MKPPLRQGSSNDFQTPKEALLPLLSNLRKDWLIWEPACGKGNLVSGLNEKGFLTVGTDILTGHDFLNWQPKEFDCIITNPPFSLKDNFFLRCYQLKKPFALLVPLTSFEGQKRQELFRTYGVEVILFDRRINFETPSGKQGGSWFMTAWFTWGLDLRKQLNFIHYASPPNTRPSSK